MLKKFFSFVISFGWKKYMFYCFKIEICYTVYNVEFWENLLEKSQLQNLKQKKIGFFFTVPKIGIKFTFILSSKINMQNSSDFTEN